MEALAVLCRRHDLWLLSDEVYEDLAFARPHVGAWSLPAMAERAIVVSSLSKTHAVPAFRPHLYPIWRIIPRRRGNQELALSTVTARRFCDQHEMSLHTATGRSLP